MIIFCFALDQENINNMIHNFDHLYFEKDEMIYKFHIFFEVIYLLID